MCDILWSDPFEGQGRAPSKRGVGVQFGEDVTEKFLKENGLGENRAEQSRAGRGISLVETLVGAIIAAFSFSSFLSFARRAFGPLARSQGAGL